MDIKEIKNVFVPYDSPLDVIFQETIDSMASAFSKSIDDGVMTAVVKAGFNVDKEKLEQALTQDKRRYEGAYRKGYEAGYTKREDEIVRCKDCKYGKSQMGEIYCDAHEEIGYDPEPTHPLDWFCADGERKEGDGE